MKLIRPDFQFSSLMISLLLFFFLFPFFEKAVTGYILFQVSFSWIILNTVYSISDHKKLRLLALALAIPPLLIRGSGLLEDITKFSLLSFGAFILLMLMVAFLILRDVLSARRVTGQVIYGAVCVYMLLALLAAMVYDWLLSVNPAAFAGNPASFSDLLYFSLVTITTLGYGDISPVSSAAKTLVSLEALLGQLYLTILIARLVGLQVSQSQTED